MNIKLKIINMVSAAIMTFSAVTMPAFAVSKAGNDVTYPIVGTVAGAGGTGGVLIAMSHTKKKKIRADENINTEDSKITASSTVYSETVCTHRGHNN